MKNPKFIKITAAYNDRMIDMTLNTNNIDSYVEHNKKWNNANCRLSISSFKHDGCDIIYIMETKEYLDDLLT